MPTNDPSQTAGADAAPRKPCRPICAIRAAMGRRGRLRRRASPHLNQAGLERISRVQVKPYADETSAGIFHMIRPPELVRRSWAIPKGADEPLSLVTPSRPSGASKTSRNGLVEIA